MSGALKPSFAGHVPDLAWRWRDRCGDFHDPSEMETRHLFHTLRMIWNNQMPVHMHVGKVKLYDFGSFYTKRYLGDAIVRVGAELFQRSDLTAQQRRELDQMASWFRERLPAAPTTALIAEGRS